ncbi:YVTN repeat-like/Quino protein amine dehydrogenase [Rhizopogon salebrosus TDB-379]|nr:YVTN repeat-like/Quino protein amine dehydrogenase [Rhizopogon salebrosus TDB-379]
MSDYTELAGPARRSNIRWHSLKPEKGTAAEESVLKDRNRRDRRTDDHQSGGRSSSSPASWESAVAFKGIKHLQNHPQSGLQPSTQGNLTYDPPKTMNMASRSTRSTGTRKMIVGMTLVGHERSFYYMDGERKETPWGPAIAYFPDGQKIISGSADKTTRLWDLQAGKEIEEARVVGEQTVDVVVVSSDGRWVVTGGLGGVHKVKANEVKAGSVKTFEGHSPGITCIDISMDRKLLASGSWDDRIRIWSLDTGELVAGPFHSVDFPGEVGAVRFSHDSRKLAVKSEFESRLEVWDIQAQKLDNKVNYRCRILLHGWQI